MPYLLIAVIIPITAGVLLTYLLQWLGLGGASPYIAAAILCIPIFLMIAWSEWPKKNGKK